MLRIDRRWTPPRNRRAALLGLLGLLGAPNYALADFDVAQGRVVLNDVIEGVGLNSANEGAALRVDYLDFNLMPVTARNQDFLRGNALEGDGSLVLGANGRMGGMLVHLDSEAFFGRRVEIKLWYQPQGTIPVADVLYEARPIPSAGFEELLITMGTVRLYPSGRATDDGWVELTSGPIDFDGHLEFRARALRVFDARLLEALLFGQTSSQSGDVLIDGLGIYDRGSKAVPDIECSLPEERALCGERGACFMGRCVEATAVMGNFPDGARVRREYLEHLGARMGVMAGGRFTIARSQGFLQELTALAEDPSPASAWSRFVRAYDDLGDGHISAPFLNIPTGSIFGGACVYEGEADLLPQAGILPLVYETFPNHPVGSQLQPGDVLTLIDGISPRDWAQFADRFMSYSGDPRGRTFVTTPDLLDAAMMSGATLFFERCALPGGCSNAQVQRIVIDLKPLLSPLFLGQFVDIQGSSRDCDFRFQREVQAPDVRDPDFVGHSDIGGVRTVLINGVDGSGRWLSSAQQAMNGVPPLVILDERTGGGGTFDGVSALLEPFLTPAADPLALLVPQLNPEVTLMSREQLVSCQNLGTPLCGNFFYLPMGTGVTPRAVQPAARIAVLNGRDVSGNDFLPFALKRRTQGETRIFGVVPTYGAFGPIYTVPRVMGELIGGSVQLHDTIFAEGLGDPSLEFHTGFGVEPDEIVYQRQSDAILGVDTMIQAARAWLVAP